MSEKSDRMSKDPILRLIIGVAVLVGALLFILVLSRGAITATVIIPWFIPMMNAFLLLVVVSVTFLAFGRYHVLRDPASFWTGIGFSGAAVGLLFNVLTFPGLLSGGRSIVGRLANTAAWTTLVASHILAVSLLLAALISWPSRRHLRGPRWPRTMVGWVVFVVVSNVLFVVFERYLPILFQPDGGFTPLFRSSSVVLVLVTSVGTILSTRRYLRTNDVLPGYAAICQLALLSVAMLNIVLVTRYDIWWFTQRILVTAGFAVALFGLLSEHVRLVRREQEKTRRLQESEERLRSLGDNLPNSTVYQLVQETDGSVRFLYVSASIERLHGVSVESVLRDPGTLFRQIPPEYMERLTEARKLSQRELSDIDMEVPIRWPEGQVYWLQLRSRPRRLDNGGTLWDGVATDVTASKRAQEALQHSERRYRRLFEASLAGVYLTKLDGTVIDFNDTMMRMLGYDSREEVFQHRSSDFYADPEFRKKLMLLLQKDGVVPGMEAVLRRKDGAILHAIGSAALLEDEQTNEPYIQGVAIDISKRKQAEEALRELTKTLEIKVATRTAELEHRAKQLQKLTLELSQAEDRERKRIAVLLHEDLQQQIAGAKFHLSLLRSRAEPDTQQKVVETIEGMLKEAIEKSRNLSHDLSPAVLQMNDLAEVLRALSREAQTKHGLTVHVKISGEATLRSESVATFLFRAAQELLFNVVKHAEVNEAQIHLRRFGQYICLRVFDQGHGFDARRLNETTGLGLLSIRERVELLGGRMKVRSMLGKGSVFQIVILDHSEPQDEEQSTEGVPLSSSILQ